ncbi:MAG: Proteasome subunit beta precursor [Candidatus Heimdallarchaeota archaeon LC_3]|nr:MAG: Proteasome subunit beta precursor [Candidatus Heimdallarchaeota archaeon LC_3]
MEKMVEMPKDEKLLKTGTTGLALRYDGGVIIAADKRVSAGYIIGKNAEKIHLLTNNIGMAISGLVSDAMSLVDVMKAELKLYRFDNALEPTVKVAASLLGVITHGAYRRYFPYWTQLIVGGADITGPHLYNIDPSGAVSEDNFMVIGSGSLFALSKLDDGWKERLSKDDARRLTIQALKLAISRDLYTGDGFNIFFFTKDGSEKESVNLKTVEA